MPIRGFLYFAHLYEKYIERHKLNIYGSKLLKLPTPQYIVFYNGAGMEKDEIKKERYDLLNLVVIRLGDFSLLTEIICVILSKKRFTINTI